MGYASKIGHILFWGCWAALPAGAAPPAGYGLVWADEFDGPLGSAPRAADWGHDLGCSGWGNNEWQNYTASTQNAFIAADTQALDGRVLVIRAEAQGGGWCGYTSARLLTAGRRSFLYGYIEARLRLPYGQGVWPALWMLGTDIGSVGWPACGEIDIMENIGRASEQGRSYGTLHGPGYAGAAGISAHYDLPAGQRFCDGYHLFAVRWEPGLVEFSVDGVVYARRSPSDLPTGTSWVFNKPHFLLINLAIGGHWPGYPDATTVFPQEFRVDYVRHYQVGVATATRTRSPTPTATVTRTGSPTFTPTATVTRTGSPTFTPTATVTRTGSPTFTPTATVTRTGSPTFTPTATVTRTESPTSTATLTTSPSLTVDTLTPTSTPEITLTATAGAPTPSATLSATTIGPRVWVPEDGALAIRKAQAFPQPDPRWMLVDLRGRAESLTLRFYSPAKVLLAELEAGPGGPGWMRVDLGPVLPVLPRGLSYVAVSARRGEVRSQTAKAPLVRLR